MPQLILARSVTDPRQKCGTTGTTAVKAKILRNILRLAAQLRNKIIGGTKMMPIIIVVTDS